MMIRSHCFSGGVSLVLGIMFAMLSYAPVAFGQEGAIERVGGMDLSGCLGKILLEGDRLYIQADDVGVHILDVSVPSSPALLGTVEEEGIFDFAVKNQYVYLARRSNILLIVDASDPGDLQAKAELTYGKDYIFDVMITGNTLICHAYNDEDTKIFTTFDISDPANPLKCDSISLGKDNNVRDRFIESDDTYAYVSTFQNTWIFDKTVLPQIRMIGYDPTGVAGGYVVTKRLMVIGMIVTYRYTCHGIRVFDFSNPAAHELRGAHYTKEDVNALDSDGWLVYAANDTAGMRVFDISNPAHPKVVAEYATEDAANDVIVHKGLAYLSTSSRIKILRYTGGQPILEQNAIAVSHTVPAKLTVGQAVSVSVTMRNNGETTWYEPDFKLALLNEDSPLWQYGWPRLHIDKGVRVQPGESFTFGLPLKAPSQPGVYTMELQMVEEFVEFFGDKLDIVVEVIANSQTDNAAWSPYE